MMLATASRWFDGCRQDVRFALRATRRAPGFAAVATLTLALGIGATTTIYSVVDTILLQPLPYAASDRLVRLTEWTPHVVAGREPLERGVTYPDFVEWQKRARTLSDAAWFAEIQRTIRTTEGTARLWAGLTSIDALSVLGARAQIGRVYRSADASNPNVMVLGADAWHHAFHGDPAVVGTTVEVFSPSADARVLTIVGVLSEDFESPAHPVDFYTPIVPDATAARFSGTMIGRLAPGVPLASALDEAKAIGAAIRPPLPSGRSPLPPGMRRFDVQILKDHVVADLRPALRVLLGAVAFVLVIVCANVANLLLARGTARQREMAVRFAIGATRGRVIRQVLTECLILALVGSVLGGACGAFGIVLVKRLAAVESPGIFRVVFGASLLPRGSEIVIDRRLLGVAFTLAALTSVAFGFLPALRLSKPGPWHAMAARTAGSGRSESRIRAALVVGQLAIATTLLVGGGLLIRSFVKLMAVENGYDPAHVVSFQVVFPPAYPVPRKIEAIEAIRTRLEAAPDIEAAGASRAGVLIPEEIYVGTLVPTGRTVDEMRIDPARPHVRPVSAGFLKAMGVRFLDGRDIEEDDAAAATPAIVVTRSVARQYLGMDQPVGQTVDWYSSANASPIPARIVGLVEDLRNESPTSAARPEMFVEYRRLMAIQERWGDPPARREQAAIGFLSFAVRARGRADSAMPTIAQVVRSVDTNIGVEAMIPMERLMASAVARYRFSAVLLSVFAGVAALLTAIGVYGVLAYAVMQRTQEIGVRMALGAGRAQVVGLVLRQGAGLASLGIAIGLAAAAGVTHVLQSMLFGITALDPQTFVAVAVLFGLVAMLAAYIPARRATRVDPMVALRAD
jgi:putative ABC transport system permease protein